jgi:hypothetical protein
VIDMDSLDESLPEDFYIHDSSLKQMADCFAVVAGIHLPLHSQLLGAQSTVLLDLFVVQKQTITAAEVGGWSTALVSAAAGVPVRLRLDWTPTETGRSLSAGWRCI